MLARDEIREGVVTRFVKDTAGKGVSRVGWGLAIYTMVFFRRILWISHVKDVRVNTVFSHLRCPLKCVFFPLTRDFFLALGSIFPSHILILDYFSYQKPEHVSFKLSNQRAR